MARSRILTHPRFTGAAKWDGARRELSAIREITHVLLNADAPEEVLQFALDRVSPLLGASFASVYLIEGVSELMRLGAAFNWPERHRPWLGGMRVRLGFGPSGEAASERRIIEVPDVTADKDMEDWAEVAKELGFRSLVALPLQSATGVLGALTFYFRDEGLPDEEKRNLMRVVADQLAMAAERSRINEELRRTAGALGDARDELEQQYRRVVEAGTARDTFFDSISAGVGEPLARAAELVSRLGQSEGGDTARELAEAFTVVRVAFDELLELSAIRSGARTISVDEFSPASSLVVALDLAGDPPAGLSVEVAPTPEMAPTARSDRQKYSRLLVTLLKHMYRSSRDGVVTIATEFTSTHVRYVVRCDGECRSGAWDDGPSVLLVRALGAMLGGGVDCRVDEPSGEAAGGTWGRCTAICEVELPLEYVPASAQA